MEKWHASKVADLSIKLLLFLQVFCISSPKTLLPSVHGNCYRLLG
jgi:hypothetical protein